MSLSRAKVCAALFLAVVSGCATDIVVGAVPPSQFHFSELVPLRGTGAGGWRAAQVIITLGNRYVAAVCRVEIGVPIVSSNGPVLEFMAQVVSANAANQAARVALTSPAPALTAVLCKRFQEEMNRLVQLEIPGARVTGFIHGDLKPTTFP